MTNLEDMFFTMSDANAASYDKTSEATHRYIADCDPTVTYSRQKDRIREYFEGVAFILPSKSNGSFDCGRNLLWLDTAATEHTMFAAEHLSDVFVSDVTLRLNCNAGYKLTNQKGFCLGFEFWVSPGGIANLLLAPELEQSGHKIKYQTGGNLEVWTTDGRIITFEKSTGVCRGMHYIDMSQPHKHIRKVTSEDSFAFVQTVRGNFEGFTAEQVKLAQCARDGAAMMAHPSADNMKHLVSSTNAVENLPFGLKDLANSDLLFGRDRGAIRGKTVRRKPEKVRPMLVNIPQQLYEKLKDVELTADVMFVNGLPFFVTLSRVIKLITAKFQPSRTAEKLVDSLETVVRIYRRGGYLVKVAMMDMEFVKLEDKSDTLINTTAAREHVGDIERAIRVIRERCRCVTSELPYKRHMPDHFVIYLVYFVVMWINAVPSTSGASVVYSPREIVTGRKMDFSKHCKARFGSYVEASDDPDVTNTERDRTAPCIALGPTGNFQGSVWCYNLETKRVVTRRTITPLPMSDRVIRRVITLGKRGRQKRTLEQRLKFLNRKQQEFDWDVDDDDDDDAEGLVEPSDTDSIRAEILGVVLEEDLLSPVDEVIEPTGSPTTADLAAAALANANLANTPISEIAGVDDNGPAVVSDAEDDPDDPGDDSDNEDAGDDDAEQLVDNNTPPQPNLNHADEDADTHEDAVADVDGTDDSDNEDTGDDDAEHSDDNNTPPQPNLNHADEDANTHDDVVADVGGTDDSEGGPDDSEDEADDEDSDAQSDRAVR